MSGRIIVIILFVLCGLCSSADADVEDWYTYWGIGLASINYPGEVGELFDLADSLPGVTRTTFTCDILGFYWPMENNQTILGVVVNLASDSLSDNYTTFSINQYLYGFSTMHFFGEEPGDGFMVRGDIGISRGVMSISGGGFSDSAVSDSGIGFLVGVGYGITVSTESRIIIGLNIANREIEGDNISTVGVTVGGLW